MQLIKIENLRLTDRNKAGGNAVFAHEGNEIGAELNFYLQGNQCLTIRLGRHDKSISTGELEKYLDEHRMEIRRQINPEVERLRREKRLELYGEE